MPKVLVAGEKALAIHSFSEDELNKTKIEEARSDSVVKIGKVFDQSDMTEQTLDAIKSSVIMLLKQSDTYKLKTEDAENYQGYVLGVYKGKTLNGKRNYIASWLGKMPEENINKEVPAMIPALLKGFKDKGYLNLSDYHKKSAIHSLIKQSD